MADSPARPAELEPGLRVANHFVDDPLFRPGGDVPPEARTFAVAIIARHIDTEARLAIAAVSILTPANIASLMIAWLLAQDRAIVQRAFELERQTKIEDLLDER